MAFLPLYGGPLLAGLAHASIWAAILLIALFSLSQIFTGRLSKPAPGLSAPVHAILLVVVQALVVGVIFGVGYLVSLIVGVPPVPMWVPVAITALGTLIVGLRYRQSETDEMNEMLDQAIASVETGASFDFSAEPDEVDPDKIVAREAEEKAMKALRALPDTAGNGMIDPIVTELAEVAGATAFPSFLADASEGSRTVDLGLLRYLALPRVRSLVVGDEALGFVFSVLLDSEDEAVMAEIASLCWTLLDENAPPHDLPPIDELADKARRFPVLEPLVDPVREAQSAPPRA